MRIHLEPVFTTVGSANRAPSEEKLLRGAFGAEFEREMRIHLEPVFTTVGSANRAPSEEKLLRGAFGAPNSMPALAESPLLPRIL